MGKWLWWLAYLALVIVVAIAMRGARQSVLAIYSQPHEQVAWEAWREEAAKTGGPVARRVPQSGEPPALVLLRDHFVVSFIGAELFASALFFALMFLIRGVWESPPPQIDLGQKS